MSQKPRGGIFARHDRLRCVDQALTALTSYDPRQVRVKDQVRYHRVRAFEYAISEAFPRLRPEISDLFDALDRSVGSS
jgi:hypothetical protein